MCSPKVQEATAAGMLPPNRKKKKVPVQQHQPLVIQKKLSFTLQENATPESLLSLSLHSLTLQKQKTLQYVHEQNEEALKVIYLGDPSVGKTVQILRYLDGIFYMGQGSTVGIDYKTKIETLHDTGATFKLALWDTAGSERFRCMTKSYLKQADAIFILYDITNRATFESLENYWMSVAKEHAEENTVLIVVGNKLDMKHKRQVTYEEALKVCTDAGVQYFETSSKESTSVNNMYQEMLKAVVAKRKSTIQASDKTGFSNHVDTGTSAKADHAVVEERKRQNQSDTNISFKLPADPAPPSPRRRTNCYGCTNR